MSAQGTARPLGCTHGFEGCARVRSAHVAGHKPRGPGVWEPATGAQTARMVGDALPPHSPVTSLNASALTQLM